MSEFVESAILAPTSSRTQIVTHALVRVADAATSCAICATREISCSVSAAASLDSGADVVSTASFFEAAPTPPAGVAATSDSGRCK